MNTRLNAAWILSLFVLALLPAFAAGAERRVVKKAAAPKINAANPGFRAFKTVETEDRATGGAATLDSVEDSTAAYQGPSDGGAGISQGAAEKEIGRGAGSRGGGRGGGGGSSPRLSGTAPGAPAAAGASVKNYGDPGIGSGLWYPPGMPNRVVADRSSPSMNVSYVPGCLNGQFAPDSSSGCALKDNYNGVRLGSGRELLLRYKTPSTITNKRVIKVGAWNGGNIGLDMGIWLSKDPTATYFSVSEYCRANTASTGTPGIATAAETVVTTSSPGWGGKEITSTGYYCRLEPNTVYYFGIMVTEAVAGSDARFQLDAMMADFLK